MRSQSSTYQINIGTAINAPGISSDQAAGPRILSFLSRQPGWKFGRGVPPRVDTVVCALTLASALAHLGADKTGAFLTESGGIVVTGYFSNWTSEILCARDGKFVLIVERGDVEVDVKEVDNIPSALTDLDGQVGKWEKKTNLSDYFTLMTLTQTEEDFRAGPLIEHLKTVKYLSSAYFALVPRAGQFVATSALNTQISLANPPFSGSFSAESYRKPPTLSNKQTTVTPAITTSTALVTKPDVTSLGS